MHWLKISLILCLVGFLKEFKPSEPFYVEYMVQPWRDLTEDELNRDILSTGAYANGVLSMVVLLVTDLLRYKPIVILTGFAGALTWGTLIWTRSFAATQVLMVFFAVHCTAEVAYFAYIYAKLPKENYLTVTSHGRAALMMGRFASGLIGQILLSTKLLGVHGLNLITFWSEVAATFFAFFLPSVSSSIYFGSKDKTDTKVDLSEIKDSQTSVAKVVNSEQCLIKPPSKYRKAFQMMWNQFKSAYSNKKVVLWSIWYSCGVCGWLQITIYTQLLWNAIDTNAEHVWNGAVEAVTTLLCAIVALLASRLHESVINTKPKMLLALFTMSICTSMAIFVMANCGNRFISYAFYAVFYSCYTLCITVASAEIAKQLAEDSYGLIFGVNTFLGYWMQIILSLTVVTDVFHLKLSIFNQFNVYGSFFAALGLIYFVLALIDKLPSSRKQLDIGNAELPVQSK